MTTGQLTFFATPTTIVISILALIVGALVCFLSWRKSGYARRTGLVESLRWIIMAITVAALNQPEWVETFRPEATASVVVLHDRSISMETRDVFDPDSEDRISRSEWVSRRVVPARWQRVSLDSEASVSAVIQPFSAQSESTEASSRTDIATPLRDTLDSYTNLRAVVLFSDGDWNEGGSPVLQGTRYRARRVPIIVVPVGSEEPLPDLQITSADAPTFVVARKVARIPFSVESTLPRDTDVVVALHVGGEELRSKEVLVPAASTAYDSIEWAPPTPGLADVKLVVSSSAKEVRDDNNHVDLSVDVREESLRVLLVESRPRWEYRYLRNALVRDPGVEVACLLFHPGLDGTGGGPHYIKSFPTAEELSKYDVVFIGDVGRDDLSSDDVQLLVGLVRQQASGLIFMPGLRGRQVELAGTPLGDLLPVHFDQSNRKGVGSAVAGNFTLTRQGRGSLLTKLVPDVDENSRLWQQLPGFHWYAPVVRAKAGSTTLAVHDTAENRYGRIPLLVTRRSGTGKVLFMGTDGAWRWRKGVEDRYHYRFWGQVIRWMAYQRTMAAGETIRLYYAPERPRVGQRVTFNANVMDRSGAPIQGAHCSLTLAAPGAGNQQIELAAEDGEWGLYRGETRFTEPGLHHAVVTCRETEEELSIEIHVQGEPPESEGAPARHEVLRELARVSRGSVVDGDDLETLLQEISELPDAEVSERRLRLWAHPLLAATLLILLATFWIGRKWNGTI